MSVVVVEIDTRKASQKTIFETNETNEQAKQFWRTLILHTHIESSLYSKEISQQVKLNPLKEVKIDNSRPKPTIDFKTEKLMEQIRMQNQIDEIKRIQNKLVKIEQIKSIKNRQREKFTKRDNISKSVLTKSELNNRQNDQVTVNDSEMDDYEKAYEDEIKQVQNIDNENDNNEDDEDFI